MNILIAAFLGGWELILVLAVIMLLFGAKKLPEFARGLGSGIKEFKKAKRDVTDEIQSADSELAAKTSPNAVEQSKSSEAKVV